MRLVLDTSVLIAAFRSPTGASRHLLSLAPTRRYELVASPTLYLEYETVLKREEQRAIHGLSIQQLDQFLIEMAAYTDKTKVSRRYRPQLRDPNDEMVLEAAINGEADEIVTFNVRDFLPAAHSHSIEVLTPGVILIERLKI